MSKENKKNKLENSFSRMFLGFGYLLNKLSPNLSIRLKQAYIDEDSVTYLSKTFLYCLGVFLTLSVTLIWFFEKQGGKEAYLGPIFGIFSAFFMYYYRLNFPKMIVKRRINNIERNLAFAVQSLYIQVSSGIPIFDAMASVAEGKYGALSREFKVTVDEVKSGTTLNIALENLSERNPSRYFQNFVWQIINTVKTGGDIAYNLDDLAKTISRDQLTALKNYGARLSPLSMAYMMIAVIVPSLGITLLITISSLPGMGTRIEGNTFWIIFLVTVILQAQFAMIIRSSRPNLIG